MRHLLVSACFFTLCLSATAQETISKEDPFSIEPAIADTSDAAPAESEPSAESVTEPPTSVLEEVDAPHEVTNSAKVDIPEDAVPSLKPIRGESLLAELSETKSVPGVIHRVSDADGNAYPIVVVQPLAFTPRPVRWFRLEGREVEETLETATGESQTLSFPILERVPVDAVVATVSPQPPVFVPLLPSMQCFGIKDGILEARSTSELGEGTDVIVTYCTEDAMDVADSLFDVYNTQLAMTGLKPQLPDYILILNLSINATQPNSLSEYLKTASIFRGSVTFFGDDEREKETEPEDKPLANNFQFPRDSDIAWSYARRDFFAGRYATSEPLLNSLIQAEAQEPMVYYLRGLLRYSRGDTGAADVDFTQGAKLESHRGYSHDICRILERVQGPGRLALERHRRSYAR